MQAKIDKLIFVYNARSGTVNALLDAGHKLISPATYSCNLCALTHSTFSEKDVWKDFRNSLAIETEFLHSDEFEKAFASKFGHRFDYPIVLASVAGELQSLITTGVLNEIKEVSSLIEVVKRAV